MRIFREIVAKHYDNGQVTLVLDCGHKETVKRVGATLRWRCRACEVDTCGGAR